MRGFHVQAVLRIERRQVIEENFVAGHFGVFEVDGFDLDEGEIALAVLGRTHLAGDGVAGAQIELANLRRRDVDIVRARQIVVFRGAQKAEAVRQAFQDAFAEDEAVLLGLRAQDLKNQLLLAHAAGAGDRQFLGDFRQVGDVFLFQFSKANTHSPHTSCKSSAARLQTAPKQLRFSGFFNCFPRISDGWILKRCVVRRRTDRSARRKAWDR